MNNQVRSAPTAEESAQYFQCLPVLNAAERIKPVMIRARSADMSDESEGDQDIGKVSKDAPAIVAFADGVSAENREAVLLGVQLAETVASKKTDIEKDPIEWLRHYAEALRYAGWLTLGGHEYGSYTTTDKSLTMDSVVLELIGAVAGPNAATVASLMGLVLDKLQKNDPLMKLFEGKSKRGSLARFRIMPCVESGQGIPVTYLLSMHCEYKSSSGGALFWKWSVTQLEIKRLAKGVEFSKATFENNRQYILEYLSGDAKDFFEGLK